MKKTIKENANKSDKELKEGLLAKKEELFGFMMDAKQNKLKNTRSIYNTRKDIARLLTLIRERELALQETQNKQVETEDKK